MNRVARRVHGAALERADAVGRAILEQMVELRSVGGKTGAGIEHAAEVVLHIRDMRPDADAPAQFLPDIGGGRQVVGMDMGFDDPLGGQPLGPDMVHDPLRRDGSDPARRRVEIQHAIDYRAAPAARVADDMGRIAGGVVENRLDDRRDACHHPVACPVPACPPDKSRDYTRAAP
jgi:hypothetical protein